MPLTDDDARNAAAKPRPYKLADGKGLYLLVKPDGARYWRLKYRYDGREKTLALGVFPAVTLGDARAGRDAAKADLRAGRDPGCERRARRAQRGVAAADSFRAVAEEWLTRMSETWTPRHAQRVRASLEATLLHELGDRPIAAIDAPELLAALRRIEARGALETARRTCQRASAVFRLAIATGRASRDPATELRGALAPPVRRPYPALAARDLPDFLARLDGYRGEPVTRAALRLLALTFVRVGELRGAAWAEFDEANAEWRIPGTRTRTGEPQIVPLSRQALEVLRALRPLTGDERLLFPHRTDRSRPISENTLLYALYRMGFRSRATGHGFRATAASTLLEMGFAPGVVDRQLGYADGARRRPAGERREYLPERARMLQQWADLLDRQAQERGERKVVSGRFGKAAA
jgi:integrase